MASTAPATVRWREPSSRLPLRWGGHRTRSWGGLLLIVSGGVALAGVTAFTPLILTFGFAVAHVVGWCIMPSAGWRRVAVLPASMLAVGLTLSGSEYLPALVLPYMGWLLVRYRPGRSWPTLSFVLAGGFIVSQLFRGYSNMLAALGIMLAVLVISAWAARLLHSRPDESMARLRAR